MRRGRRIEPFFELGAEGVEDGKRAGAVFEHADGQAARAGFDEKRIAGDLGAEDHIGRKKLAESGGGFRAFGEVSLHHGEADAEHFEARIHHAEAVESIEQFGNGADAERFCLLGNENGVARCDDVSGDAEKSRGGIDEAEVEAAACCCAEKGADAGEVGAHAAAGFVITGLSAGDEGKCLKPRGDDEFFDRDRGIHEVIVKTCEQARLACQRKSDRALRIAIDQQSAHTGAGESMGEVDGESGFSHSAFLAGNCDTDHSCGLLSARLVGFFRTGRIFLRIGELVGR